MFGNGKGNTENTRSTPTGQSSSNHIGAGTSIEGEIKSNGVIRIDGKVVGTINSTEKLVVGQSGVIEGDIQCKNAIVEGKIRGTLKVANILDLKKSAVIEGDISTQKLVVEEGAVFNGTCSMGSKSSNGTSTNGKQEVRKTLKKETV